MKKIVSLIPALLVSTAAFSQSKPARAEFEVASVKPSVQQALTQITAGLQIDGAQVHASYLSLKDYIRIAYDVKDHQISGPDWLASQRYDISAKLPAGAAGDQIRDMMKSLLEDRFQLKIHHETRDFPVYGLVVAKGGLKMKESPPDSQTDSADASKAPVKVTANGGPAGTSVDLGKGSSFTMANNKFEARKLNMVAFADTLARFVDRPVVDMTELKGSYDFTLDFTTEDYRAMRVRSAIAAGVTLPPEALRALDGSSGDSLFASLQILGLKLENHKAPLEMLVVDQVLKTPTEN